MYISDSGNRRVHSWFRGAQNGETIIGGLIVTGIAQDDQGSLYVSDYETGQVRKWNVGETIGQVIAKGLKTPRLLFVDQNRSVFVVDEGNHRVIKVDGGSMLISIVGTISFSNKCYFGSVGHRLCHR